MTIASYSSSTYWPPFTKIILYWKSRSNQILIWTLLFILELNLSTILHNPDLTYELRLIQILPDLYYSLPRPLLNLEQKFIFHLSYIVSFALPLSKLEFTWSFPSLHLRFYLIFSFTLPHILPELPLYFTSDFPRSSP